MKKALFTGIILTVAALTAGAFAQNLGVGTTSTDAVVTHKVLVNIPNLVVLKVNYTGTAASAVVNFDFTASTGLSAYESAINTGTPVQWSNSVDAASNTTLTSVQVLSNSLAAPTVTVQIAADTSNASSMPASDVLFDQHVATSPIDISPTGATNTFTTVAQPSNFWIKADPAATPGSASYTVTYTAVAN